MFLSDFKGVSYLPIRPVSTRGREFVSFLLAVSNGFASHLAMKEHPQPGRCLLLHGGKRVGIDA